MHRLIIELLIEITVQYMYECVSVHVRVRMHQRCTSNTDMDAGAKIIND